MSSHHLWEGSFRKLWPTETDKFRDHLLRLDPASRRMRFAHAVSDGFIVDYAKAMAADDAVVYAYIEKDKVCAVAELRKIAAVWGDHAEAAFSVEDSYRDQGIATELLGRIIRSARNRGVGHLLMNCLAENSKMQRVARHFDAELRFESGDVIAEILPEMANPISFFAEAIEDRMDYLMAVFDLRTKTGTAKGGVSKAA